MLFHLFLLVLIIFTLFFFYTDVMNKINTNKPFAEGFSGTRDARNDSMYTCSTGGSYATYSANTLTPAQKAKVAELYPGKPASYYACVQGCSGGCAAAGDGVMKSVVDAAAPAPATTTYFKTENNKLCSDVGKDPITTSSECKEAAEKLNLTWSNDFNGNGDHPNCLFSNDGRSKVHFNTSSTPGGAQPNYQSLCKNKPVSAPSQTGQQSLVTFVNWRKKYLGSQVDTEVNSSKPYGSVVANWDECKNVLNTNPAAKQVVYSKSSKACYPMKEKSEEDQDGKGGTNMDWTSAQLLPFVSDKCALEYCNTYPDLKKAFCDDKECTTKSQAESCINHWYTYGVKEGRKPNPVECTQQAAPVSAASAGMDITTSTTESSRVDPTTGAKVTEKCVTVSQLDSASKWVDHLFGTLSDTKCADKDKVMAAKTASKTDFIAGVIKGFQNDRQASTDYYMSAIDKAKPMLDAAFDVNTQNVATANSQHPLLQGGEGGEDGIEDAPNQNSLAEGHTQNNVTANMANGATDGLDQHSSVPSVTTLEDQLKQTPAYQQAMNQISNKDNYEMANGNLVQPATGTCPNGCRAPQYDNEKCTNQMIGGKAYRSCPWIGDGSINDSMCKDCGSILMPKNEYGYARTRPGLFSKNTLHNLLAGTQFNKEPEKPNADYVNIGIQFMTELSMARNFRLPYIPQEKYETIGKIVHKYQLNHNNSADSKKDLSNIINGLLNSDKIPTTINSINNGGNGQLNGAVSTSILPNEDAFTLQNTLNEPSTNEDTERSEKIIKGLMGADNFYKSASQGAAETQGDNRLGGSKTLFDQSKKHSGYTTKYRPQDPRHRPKPYDSIWELFKQ